MRITIKNKTTGFKRELEVPLDKRGRQGVAGVIKAQLGLKG